MPYSRHTMADGSTENLAREVESLLDSERGELLLYSANFVRKRIKRWALIFFAGMMVGYPLSGMSLSWLLQQSELVPNDVSIVVLQPLEVVILQLRLSAHLAVAIVFLAVIIEASLQAVKNDEIRSRIKGIDFSKFSSLNTVFLSLLCSIGFGAAGIWYVIDFLLPLLLEYLQADAASIGATTTWQLSAWIGFIAGLCLGAVIGFQVPLITMIALRGNIIQRDELTNYRKHLWFAGFCAGALLSPPDPLSMFLVAGPMIVLFEVALLIDAIIPQKS